MTEVTPHPLKTQGFHHFFILLFYDHPANDVTIMKEGHPEAGTPSILVGQVGIEPTMFQMSRFYRPLRSPTTRTDPYGGERRTRI